MATFHVSTQAQLLSALSSADGGDSIAMASGNYGAVLIDQDYASMVTIRSASPLAAKFSTLHFSGASNVRVEGIHVDNAGNGAERQSLIQVDGGSHDVQLVDSEVNGAVDRNYSGWQAVYVGQGSRDILIQNNDIHDAYRGFMAFGVSNLQVLGNAFDRIGEDTMKFGVIDDVLIENNLSRGPFMQGSHLDFMQFQGNSSDIVIRGNVLLPEARGNMQGLFFGDSTASNVLIEQNFINTSMHNGVYIVDGSGIEVRNNTLINLNRLSTAIIVPDGSKVTGNIYTGTIYSNSPLGTGFLGENLLIQTSDPARPHYVTNYYANGDKGLGLTPGNLGIVPGSFAELLGAATRIRELIGGTPSLPTPPDMPPETPTSVYALPGDHDFVTGADVISVAPSGAFAVSAATIAFSFNADRVDGLHGLVTRDASGAIGGGNHFATQIEDGRLSIVFEGASARKAFTMRGIEANQDYTVHAAFGDGHVYAWLNQTLVGYAEFGTDWTANGQYLQVGAHNASNAVSGGTSFTNVFDGTISDLRIVTGVLTPSGLAALPPPGDDGDPVFARTGGMEFNGSLSDTISVPHDPALEIAAGSISFAFNPDTLSGRQGLVSKDAQLYAGGGNNFSAWLEGDLFKLRFKDEDSTTVFRFKDVRADRTYDILATFDEETVGLYVNGRLVGEQAFSIDLTDNRQFMHVGALGWSGADGANAPTNPFDGTISDLLIFDEVLTPLDLI